MNYDETLVICLSEDTESSFAKSLSGLGCKNIVTASSGAALRDAFKDAAGGSYKYVVTVDEKDGFSIDDVFKVAEALYGGGETLYIGTHSCEVKKNAPSAIFGFLSGLDAEGTAASLYGMPASICGIIAEMKSSDENFLFNIPLEARANDIAVKEVKTAAACGEAPGFALLTRSFKLYYVFIKFSIAAMIAYLVDIISFYFLERAFDSLEPNMKILWATVLSRVLCSIATYILNRGAVFKSHAKSGGAIVRFLILSAGQLAASWLLVLGIGSLLGGGDLTNMLVKVVVDLVIFMASFTIQRDWVFKKTEGLLQ